MSKSKTSKSEQPEASAEQSTTFDQQVLQAIQQNIIDFIRKGEWMTIDYSQRTRLDPAFFREMQSKVDMNKVMDIVKGKVEERIADNILNTMATEIATDVKSIMCNRELREDIRSVIRAKIRSVEKALKD